MEDVSILQAGTWFLFAGTAFPPPPSDSEWNEPKKKQALKLVHDSIARRRSGQTGRQTDRQHNGQTNKPTDRQPTKQEHKYKRRTNHE